MTNPLFGNDPNTRWEIWLCFPNGARRKALDMALAWSCGRVVNDLGGFELTLPVKRMEKLGLIEPELDSLVVFSRAAWGSPLTEFMGGFVRAWDYTTDEMTLKGYGYNYLLDGRVIAYYAGSSQASKEEYADDLMKALVRENLGSLATDTTRDLTALGFTVAADLTLGERQDRAFANKELLDVLRDVSFTSVQDGTPVYFEVVHPTPSTFEFTTYINQPGKDLTSTLLPLSAEAGTLTNPRYLIDRRQEVNRIRVGGKNEGYHRTYTNVNDTVRQAASVWNLRERFLDRRNLTDAQLEDAGLNALQAAQPIKKFSANLLDTKGSRFGVDWNFGDRVPARFMGLPFSALIKAVNLSVNNDGGETITARMETDL